MVSLFYYLVIINVISFVLYGIDKYKAKHRKFRIPECVLFIVSFLGGSLGAIFGMYVFRHKTKKLWFYVLNYAFLGMWLYLFISFK